MAVVQNQRAQGIVPLRPKNPAENGWPANVKSHLPKIPPRRIRFFLGKTEIFPKGISAGSTASSNFQAPVIVCGPESPGIKFRRKKNPTRDETRNWQMFLASEFVVIERSLAENKKGRGPAFTHEMERIRCTEIVNGGPALIFKFEPTGHTQKYVQTI